MPIQKTFTIIPTISRDASPLPAFAGGRMTSKQVKQAYKTTNKAPRVSRAEQLKLDRAEQQRIRKEMEKEKASAKARLLRDKKKEKEAAEREVKKREGRPIVNVRPSQDTIARFVRGNDKRRDILGTMANAAPAEVRQSTPADAPANDILDVVTEEDRLEEDSAQPQHANRSHKAPIDHILDAIAEEDDLEHSAQPQRAYQSHDAPFDKPEARVDSPTDPEDKTEAIGLLPAADIPSDLLEDFDSSFSQQPMASKPIERPEKPAEDDTLAAMLDEDLDTDLSQDVTSAAAVPLFLAPEELPRPEVQIDSFLEEDLDLDELESLIDPRPVAAHLPQPEKPSTAPRANADHFQHARDQAPQTNNDPCSPKHQIDQHAAQTVAEPSQIPHIRTKPRSPSPVMHAPPLSTQAIMLNLDDFFPTSSQQARELDHEEDFGSSFASVTPRQAMPPPATPMQPPQPSFKSPRALTPIQPTLIPRVSPAQKTPSPRPERWFTASGSKERESLAIQRSRRTAALEELQMKERRRAGWADCANVRSREPPVSSATKRKPQARVEEPPQKRGRCGDDKENSAPAASQESDYGGGWMEDFEF